MIFLTIVFKNLLRRRTRSLLTMTGIAIGIAAVVALTSIAKGFEKSWERAYAARGTDLIITKVTSRSPMPATFSEQIKLEIARLPHVKEVGGLLSDLVSIEDAPTVLVFGWEPNSFLWDHLKLVKGRLPTNNTENAVVVGAVAADMLKKNVGSPIQIEAREFIVCGIFESSALVENGAVVMSLPQLQQATDQPNKVNFLNVRLVRDTTRDQIEALRATIHKQLVGFKAFTGGEVAQNNTAIQVAKAMSWATSLIALVVGAVGIMNTVLMSVFERMQEIGILLAIGWRRSRILRMILYESVALSLCGGFVGIVVGVGVVKLLQATAVLRGKIEGETSLLLFVTALAIALALGILGGLYPAYRCSRLRPGEALRYE